MKQITIDTDIPAPHKPNRYPWDKIEPGQSFFVGVGPGQDINRLQVAICSNAYKRRDKRGEYAVLE